jgi:plasmid maintenance system antidote protein VapI
MKSGAQLFREWMDRCRYNQQEAADFLGMHFTFVSMLVNGHRTPSLRKAFQIERMTGVPAASWLLSGHDKDRRAPVSNSINA